MKSGLLYGPRPESVMKWTPALSAISIFESLQLGESFLNPVTLQTEQIFYQLDTWAGGEFWGVRTEAELPGEWIGGDADPIKDALPALRNKVRKQLNSLAVNREEDTLKPIHSLCALMLTGGPRQLSDEDPHLQILVDGEFCRDPFSLSAMCAIERLSETKGRWMSVDQTRDSEGDLIDCSLIYWAEGRPLGYVAAPTSVEPRMCYSIQPIQGSLWL